jgi:hypothetical protein
VLVCLQRGHGMRMQLAPGLAANTHTHTHTLMPPGTTMHAGGRASTSRRASRCSKTQRWQRRQCAPSACTHSPTCFSTTAARARPSARCAGARATLPCRGAAAPAPRRPRTVRACVCVFACLRVHVLVVHVWRGLRPDHVPTPVRAAAPAWHAGAPAHKRARSAVV